MASKVLATRLGPNPARTRTKRAAFRAPKTNAALVLRFFCLQKLTNAYSAAAHFRITVTACDEPLGLRFTKRSLPLMSSH